MIPKHPHTSLDCLVCFSDIQRSYGEIWLIHIHKSLLVGTGADWMSFLLLENAHFRKSKDFEGELIRRFPGHWPGSLANVHPASNLSVKNVPFLNFSPSVKTIFFLLWKFYWEQIFYFLANTVCVLLLIFMMIITYQASGLVWWALAFYITLTFSRLDEHFYSWSPNRLKDQDTDNLEELRSSSVGFYNVAPILLIISVSSP